MKRGKDEEKSVGPMFPRLHVNDTEKGGPRAPPRNKMALYEQLSIPSQRFNTSTSNSVPPPASSSQGGVHGRGAFSPLQQASSVHQSERMNNRYSNLSNRTQPQEQKKKHEEDDFSVPIFDQSRISQNLNVNPHGMDKEGFSRFSSGTSGRKEELHSVSVKETKQTDTRELTSRQEGVSRNEENTRLVKSVSNQSSRQGIKRPLEQTDTSSSLGQRGSGSRNIERSLNDGNLQVKNGFESHPDDTIWEDNVSNGAIRLRDHGNSSIPVSGDQQEMLRSPNGPTNSDAVSETSMVDSISCIDISPDDVVGIIGQKHFWKARRAIVNQQRVFAVQVFELHRLIKVQKLIAKSPHLLLENAYVGQTLKPSATKILPLEYIDKPTPNVSKKKDDCQKPDDDKIECSAENAVGKASLSSVQVDSQFSNYKPFSGNALPTSDPKAGPWGFNPPSGHQWLIPVMSPSEGLVYKPYPGPGFMGPACGPPGSTPIMGPNFINYGAPPSHNHYQGPGLSPFAPPSQGYFPPFGMPVVNPTLSSSTGEQMNQFNKQYQGFCKVPSEKNGGPVAEIRKLNSAKESEVQVSTASSPSDQRTKGRNALQLFPTTPAIQLPDALPEPREANTSSRVIKVVPHKARLATESAARIFRTIQEERKQPDCS